MPIKDMSSFFLFSTRFWKERLYGPDKGSTCHFMDKIEVGNETSEELTRESLIAISYSVPVNDHSPSLLPNKLSGDFVGEGINGDGAENYRSKLISISNKQSPDIKAQPVSPEPWSLKIIDVPNDVVLPH